MPKIKINVPHKVSQEEVIKRLKNFSAELKKEHGDTISNLQERWENNKVEIDLSVKGISTKISMEITPQELIIIGKIPLIALPFKGKIEQTIKDKVEELMK